MNTSPSPAALRAASAIWDKRESSVYVIARIIDAELAAERASCRPHLSDEIGALVQRWNDFASTHLPSESNRELASMIKALLAAERAAAEQAHFQLAAVESVFRDVNAPYDYGQTAAVNLKRLIAAQIAKHNGEREEWMRQMQAGIEEHKRHAFTLGNTVVEGINERAELIEALRMAYWRFYDVAEDLKMSGQHGPSSFCYKTAERFAKYK